MRLISFLLVFGTCFSNSLCFYSSDSAVVKLTESNFDRLVVEPKELWVVQFYATWCGHSKSFVAEYQKTAQMLQGIVKVGAVNVDNEKSLSARFGIKGFPTVKIFVPGTDSPVTYNQARTADDLVSEVFKLAKKVVDDRFGGKRKESTSNEVVELTDSNFDRLVLQSDDIWLVEFFAPWCGHCKNLAPHWAKAANELRGKVKLGALDCTTHTVKANEYGVQGYPTIKFFPGGKKDKHSAEDYQGGRTSSDIVAFAMDKLMESLPAPEVQQITSENTLKEACDKPLCVIAVLPHILDCQAKCRSSYVETLQNLGDKFRKKLWGWVWSEAGAQPELENALEIGGFGYPAMAVLNAKKMKYSILRGSFSKDGINEFLRDLSYGRGTTAPLKGASLPKVVETEPWDGKDGEPPQDDDVDLSDVELDDLPKDEL
ncbi:protein disulfide-isomerase A6 homolog [Cimex lectularius]|uniref:protein disulfide-isomerase n=1 Tax=Cimex lectularius TaxID=79782 RepID=A0A8I6RWG6_CIMLE|nr:protein disulfide-isomerase A6 homolog [Cimex lectularius]